MKKKENKLAIFGGKKVIRKNFTHYLWPPKSLSKIKHVSNYLKNEKLNSFGYPKIIEDFENKFKKIHKRKYSLSLNSGTSAMHAALYALGLKKTDEVIAPSITFHATATPIKSYNSKIVFCDCDPKNGNISVEDLKKKISRKTKVLIITHLCGHPCEMDEIMKIVKKYKVFLIEDCSHAHLSKYKNKLVGRFGDIAIFSMDRNKLLSTGEGGVLITDKKLFFQRALLTSDFGPRLGTVNLNSLRSLKETGNGFKHRMHPVSAAIALNELKNLKKYIKLRHKNLNYLSREIKNIDGLKPPFTYPGIDRGAFYSYRVFFDRSILGNVTQKKIIETLQAEGLQVRTSGNRPLHLLPFFKETGKKQELKNSEKFYNSTISLPTFTFEKKEVIDLYIKGLKKVCNYYKRK